MAAGSGAGTKNLLPTGASFTRAGVWLKALLCAASTDGWCGQVNAGDVFGLGALSRASSVSRADIAREGREQNAMLGRRGA